MTIYYDFVDEIENRRDISTFVKSIEAARGLAEQLTEIGTTWWTESWPLIQMLNENVITPPQLEELLLESLREQCAENTMLDRYEVAGVFARWWREIHWDLHTLRHGGAIALLGSWSQSYLASISSEENKDLPLTEVETGVRDALMPSYATDLIDAEAIISGANNEIQTLDYGEDWGSMNAADKKLEIKGSKTQGTQKAVLKKEKIPLNKFVTDMQRGTGIRSGTSIAKLRAEGKEAEALATEQKVAEDIQRIGQIDEELQVIQTWLNEYKALTEQRKIAKGRIKELGSPEWIEEQMTEHLKELDIEAASEIISRIIGGLFLSQLSEEIRVRQNKVIQFFESGWDRYRENLRDFELQNEESKNVLDSYLEVLGYDS